MKNGFLFALISICFLHCKHSPKKSEKKAPSRVYQAKPLDSLQKNRWMDQCAAYCRQLLDQHGFNGSYLVAKEGNILLEKYVGFVDPSHPTTPLQADDAIHLASVSKTFTAMAVCQLWQEGKIDLDAELNRYFDQFPYPGVTVRMLLNHRSGLPNYLHYLETSGWDRKKMVTNLDVLASLYTLRPPLQFVTGKHFGYCNTNYVLLALLIEKVSNETYPQYLQNHLFGPLNMQHSFVYQLKDSARATPSFQWNNRKYGMEFLDLTYGDKNIYSTVRDMMKWDQGLYDTTLFSYRTLEAAFQPYSFEKDGKKNYGLGWRMTLLDNGKKILFHNGWWHGNNTVFIRLLDEKTTIIILGNKFNRNIYRARGIADYFGDYQQNLNRTEDE